MFQVGDLIKYTGSISSYRIGRPFTVLESYRYRDNTFSCIRSGMSYSRQFKEEDMEHLDMVPKFSLGEAVEMNHRGMYPRIAVGVIIASNQAGSIVRFADEYNHHTSYVPNGKLKRIK